jgi:hypothetical protein
MIWLFFIFLVDEVHIYIIPRFVVFDPSNGEVYSIQHYHYVIKFVSDLWQVDGFLRVLRFPPPIKLTTMI